MMNEMDAVWSDAVKDDAEMRNRGDREDRYSNRMSRQFEDQDNRQWDNESLKDMHGRRRSSSSSSRIGRHRDDKRSRSRSRSRSRTRTRSRSRSRSRSPSYRRSSRRHYSRSRSRSRSRDRYDSRRGGSREYGYSNSPMPDNDLFNYRYYRDRRLADVVSAPPNSTLVVKGLPPEWEESAMWELLNQHGFQPKDIRILKRRDTGQGRGFGFVEFHDVDEAIRWMEHTQGRLKVEERYWADIQYSKAPHISNAPTNLTPASALAAIFAQRGGDWICAKCGTNNFKKRDLCFKCNLKREESESLSADGYSEIGVVPCDTLLLRNLPEGTDETKIMSALKSSTALEIHRVMVARNPSTETARGYAYVQMANVTEATQLLTTLTTLMKLTIDDKDIAVTYSKYPLTVVLTGSNLTHGSSGNWAASSAFAAGGGYIGLANASQTDVTNAAAAVAQSAIKKAHVMRQVAAQAQAAQFASLRAATMFVPTSAFLLQHQQILAAQALHEMATVQLLQEHVNRQASALANLGNVQTPHGELPKYPVPEVHKFQIDPSTGYYFDPTTGLHYDANSQYFYNSETRQYLYWDSNYQTYLPAPTGTEDTAAKQETPQVSGQVATSTENTTATSATTVQDNANVEKKKPAKEKNEKVNVAKKIQKDMEKWAKQLNQRKEAQSTKPVVNFAMASRNESSAATSTDEPSTGSADTAFSILERTGSAPGFRGSLTAYDTTAGDSDEDIDSKITTTSSNRNMDDSEFTDWTKMACLLCRRQFPSKDVLVKHQQFSDLHKKNLLARQQQSAGSMKISFDQPSTGIQYRDRARERREKFGADDDAQSAHSKQKYFGAAPRPVEERPEPASFADMEPANTSNIGSKLLKNMGWQEGQGLGRSNQGIVDPIMSQRRIQGAGLGASGAVLTASASASYKDHVKAALRQKFYQDTP